MFVGNELLLQSLLSAPSTQMPVRPQPQPANPFFVPSSPSLIDLQNQLIMPNLQQLLLNNTLTSNTQQQQLCNQLQFQLLCLDPGFLSLLSRLTGATLADVHEVKDDRHEKLHEKISPEPIMIPSRKRVASTSPGHQVATKKSKALRKLHSVDAETNSPVSGMYIKEASEVSADDLSKAYELDETAACVEITEESKRKIAEIPNMIGKSKCSLCKREFQDVFRLAMHRCPRIIHAEYKCPECNKSFSCPANLASHQRWHQPRNSISTCTSCFQQFETKKSFREHKCPNKAFRSPRNSVSSIVTASSSPGTSLMDSSTSVSPSDVSTIHVHSPQPALISLGLNTNSLQISDFH